MRGGGVRGRGGGGAGGTPNRPQRTRKLPSHLADDQFESPLRKGEQRDSSMKCIKTSSVTLSSNPLIGFVDYFNL